MTDVEKAGKSGSGGNLAGELWGGLAAMLVALPSSIAFGVAIYAVLGSASVAQGAMAGILGAMAMGLIAPIFGGAPRLISAPCAPAAAVLTALAVGLLGSGAQPGQPVSLDKVLFILTLIGLLAGVMQFLYGALGGGRLIKYIPYPVVSGYLSGVGVLIFLSRPEEPATLIRRMRGYQFGASDPARVADPSTELRTYGIGAQMLLDIGVQRMRVLGAPRRLTGLSGFDLEVVEYVS
jgi:SulP family sulfate permease